MLTFGLLLVACGVAAIVLAHRRRDQVHTMLGADRLTVAELRQQRDIMAELGTAGGFRKVCEVTGYAHPHADGPLRSPQTGTECVWFRRTVRRRTGDDSGLVVVEDESSEEAYELVAETGNIGVVPFGAVPVQPEHVGSRFVPAGPIGAAGHGAAGWRPHGAGHAVPGDQFDEWVLRAGTPLYVLGEVRERDGALVLGAPGTSTDPFVVSTRAELDLRADSTLLQQRYAWGGAAAGLVGLGVVVLALVT